MCVRTDGKTPDECGRSLWQLRGGHRHGKQAQAQGTQTHTQGLDKARSKKKWGGLVAGGGATARESSEGKETRKRDLEEEIGKELEVGLEVT